MREQIYLLIRKSDGSDLPNKVYNVGISVVALLSILPLIFKDTSPALELLDTVTVYLLFLDYILRWITCDYFTGRKHWSVFLRYPVSPLALIDLIALLPSLDLLGQSFRILRMLRIFKLLHYFKSFSYIANVVHKERRTLGSVLIIALFYIFVSALAMFSCEPDTFETFFDAFYWATTALTTVGDVYPVTRTGQVISMFSALFGIVVTALPAGIVAGGFIEEIRRAHDTQQSEATALALKQAQLAAQEAAKSALSAESASEEAQEILEATQALEDKAEGEVHA